MQRVMGFALPKLFFATKKKRVENLRNRCRDALEKSFLTQPSFHTFAKSEFALKNITRLKTRTKRLELKRTLNGK